MDLSDKQFGRWTVLPESRIQNGARYWLCKCSCPKETKKWVNQYSLMRGESKSCGCLVKEMGHAKAIDLTGKQFGRLTVISQAENKRGRVFWNCQCECGKIVSVSGHDLVRGGTKSCGCLRDEGNTAYRFQDDHTYSDYLLQKTPSNNTSGQIGVRKVKERYRAYITFDHKQWHLGYFTTFEDAQKARLEAEDRLFKPYLDAHPKKRDNPDYNEQN